MDCWNAANAAVLEARKAAHLESVCRRCGAPFSETEKRADLAQDTVESQRILIEQLRAGQGALSRCDEIKEDAGRNVVPAFVTPASDGTPASDTVREDAACPDQGEPWYWKNGVIRDVTGDSVFNNTMTAKERQDRYVACVNAMKGIADPAAYRALSDACAGDADRALDSISHLEQEKAKLQARADVLAEIIRNVINILEREGDHPHLCKRLYQYVASYDATKGEAHV